MPKKPDLSFVNEDELIGYIMSSAYEYKGINLDYETVATVLEYELFFLKEKGIAKDGK